MFPRFLNEDLMQNISCIAIEIAKHEWDSLPESWYLNRYNSGLYIILMTLPSLKEVTIVIPKNIQKAFVSADACLKVSHERIKEIMKSVQSNFLSGGYRAQRMESPSF